MTSTERLLSTFLTDTTPRDLQHPSPYELHYLVGLHSTTGATVHEYIKKKQQSEINWYIPGTNTSPLHVAVFRNSYHVLSVVQALLQINPMIKQTPMMDGNLPLHIYLQHAMTMDRRVLDLLLLTTENCHTPNAHGDRPITLLYHNVLRFQWARNWEWYDSAPLFPTHQSTMTMIAPRQFLEYALLLLNNTEDVYQLCQSPECPPLVLRILLLEQKKPHCPFLLHAAAQATASCRPPLWHDDKGDWPTLISYLLQQFGQQSNNIRDEQCQRLPLHYALESSTNVADIRQLVEVSYEEIDPVTKLPPALLYATRDNECDLDYLYELVRAYPVVCMYQGLPSEIDKDTPDP